VVGARVEVRRDFFGHFIGGDAERLERVARAIAKIRVRSMGRVEFPSEPLLGEVLFEKRFLGDPARRIVGMLYDGLELQGGVQEPDPPAGAHAGEVARCVHEPPLRDLQHGGW